MAGDLPAMRNTMAPVGWRKGIRIREFGTRFRDSVEPLRHWANAVRAAAWRNPGELKADFGSASFVGELTVFNVGGNKYRLIAFVHYTRQIVYIKHILTHLEY